MSDVWFNEKLTELFQLITITKQSIKNRFFDEFLGIYVSL